MLIIGELFCVFSLTLKTRIPLLRRTMMRLIDKIEEELLALTAEERLELLKDIGYFLQSAAQVMKAEGNKKENPLAGDE